MVVEAGAGFGGGAERVDTLLGADWVTELLVVDVADVAGTAWLDTAEVGPRLKVREINKTKELALSFFIKEDKETEKGKEEV